MCRWNAVLDGLATALVSAALLLCLPACGDDDPYYAGGPCRDDRDCPRGAKCEHKPIGGECLWECRDDRDCPQAQVCIDAHGGTCHLLCRDDRDCPRPYDCKRKKNEGRGGDSLVCED